MLMGWMQLSAVHATDVASPWLQTRDQNPFVLGSGLPLPPVVPQRGAWQVDATFNVANTELAQTSRSAALLFDAETRESRVGVAWAIGERWTLRASISHFAIGAGVLDGPIEGFHRAFGFDNGDRGRLDTRAPTINVRDDDQQRIALVGRESGPGPAIVDLARVWHRGPDTLGGLSFGLKFATGSASRLGDTGSTDLSLGAFTQHRIGERWTVAARAGVLYQHDNTLLGDRARDLVPYAGAALGYRVGRHWDAILQADAHAALYRGLPAFFGAANLLSFGVSRRFGDRAALFVSLAEDLPALHTTDVVLQLGWRWAGARP